MPNIEKILGFIRTEFPDGQSVAANTPLSGIVDSVGIFVLIAFLEKEFDVRIPDEEVTVENFDTAARIELMLARFGVHPSSPRESGEPSVAKR